jgi:DNA-binding response OmpR family regulator
MADDEQKYLYHSLCLDAQRGIAKRFGVDLHLTRRDFRLLAGLFGKPGRIYTHPELYKIAFPDSEPTGAILPVVNLWMWRLRAKLGLPPIIYTVWGVGYGVATSVDEATRPSRIPGESTSSSWRHARKLERVQL